MKYHLGENGPAPCTASKRSCPVGGPEEHYGTREEAEDFYSRRLTGEHGLLPAPARRETLVTIVEDKVRRLQGEQERLGKAWEVLSSSSLEDGAARQEAWREVEGVSALSFYSGPEDFADIQDFFDALSLARYDTAEALRQWEDPDLL